MNPHKSTEKIKTVGLNATTIYNNEVYFFLFADIDTKEKATLEKVLNIFANHHLTTYHYETSKGYHVISPCLLHIRLWIKYQKDLAFLDYRFDTIRISKRLGDKPTLYYDHFNKHYRHLESKTFHNLFRNIYGYSEIEPHDEIINTKLSFTQYDQLKLKSFKSLDLTGAPFYKQPKPLFVERLCLNTEAGEKPKRKLNETAPNGNKIDL